MPPAPFPRRRCNGATNASRTHAGQSRCEKPATLLSTAPDGLQWYSCDDPTHQAERTEPLAAWYAREVLGA